jgi:hypothetical protein
MNAFTGKVMSAAAPVFGAGIGIAVLRAAHLPFPPALSFDAWPQWVLFASVVHSATALCLLITGRVFDAPARAAETT